MVLDVFSYAAICTLQISELSRDNLKWKLSCRLTIHDAAPAIDAASLSERLSVIVVQ